MSARLLLTSEAEDDIAEADAWYEERSRGLGERFLHEVQRCLVFIIENPKGFQRVYLQFRQAPLSHFPFVIIYRIEADMIIIVRVFHTSQHPEKRFRRKK